MGIVRTRHDEGHIRKFMVVIDDTPECDRALVYAALRAARTGGGLLMLSVVEPRDFQHWLGVETIMRTEARAEAEEQLAEHADTARAVARIEPELIVREGRPSEEITAQIAEDQDIAILVLGAGTEKEGPGPLVSSLAGGAVGTFPIPITVVPGTLSDKEIDAIA